MTDPLTATDYANRTSPDTPISNAAVCSVATGLPLVPLEVAQGLERDARRNAEDAARYKWLRAEYYPEQIEYCSWYAAFNLPVPNDEKAETLDAAIDAALKEKP